MTQYRDIILRGHLTTAEPFTYTDPNWDAAVALHPTMPMLGGVPYITGSSLRGALRRAATRALFRISGGRRFTPEAMVMTALGVSLNPKSSQAADGDAAAADAAAGGEGGAKKKKEKKPAISPLTTADMLATRAANPVVSLFGTMGPRQVAGVLAVSHCRLEDSLAAIGWTDGTWKGQTRIHATRSDPQRRDHDLADAVAAADFDAYCEEQRGKAAHTSAAKGDVHKARADLAKARKRDADGAELAELQARLAAAEAAANEEATNPFGVPINYPYVQAGARFGSTMRLMHASAEDLALFAQALDYFACYPRLGGHAAAGMGLMDGEWEILERPAGDPLAPVKHIGKVRFAGNDYGRAQWSFDDPESDFREFDFGAVALDYLPWGLRSGGKPKQERQSKPAQAGKQPAASAQGSEVAA